MSKYIFSFGDKKSKKISNSSVHLPSSTGLTHEQIDFIVKKIKEFLK